MTHDEKIRFLDNLETAIKFHRTNPDDPHKISNAVICSLVEVRVAFAKACFIENYTKDITPPAVTPP